MRAISFLTTEAITLNACFANESLPSASSFLFASEHLVFSSHWQSFVLIASKGAIEGFAKALAAEYAPSFRVNVIAPSLTDTPLAGKLLANDKKREMMDARHPLKRVGQAEDIAKVAAFLLSDDSSWVTGQVLGIDGGMSTLNVN